MKLKEIYDQGNFIERVEVELRKLAAENPDFVYNPFNEPAGCVYNGPCCGNPTASQDKRIYGPSCPGCIFGQAFQALGWDDENELNHPDNIYLLLEDLLGSYCPDGWSEVQRLQDNGKSWGEAIKALDL